MAGPISPLREPSPFKDFSKTSKTLSNSFQGLKLMENTDLSVKILLQKC